MKSTDLVTGVPKELVEELSGSLVSNQKAISDTMEIQTY